MFNSKKKNIIYASSAALLLVAVSGFIPAVRKPVVDLARNPFILVNLIQREIGGIIFFHRNMTQNERLRKENDFLKFKLNAADEVYRENSRLHALLNFKQKSAYKVVAARVIGHSPDSWSSAVIIDKGRMNGIRPGMAAITFLGLCGRVSEASEYSSKVMLINDPNIGVSAVVKRSRQEGLVCGTLGSSLIMKYLPKECDIKPSDLVVTSGLTENYPKGLLIGTVVEVGDEFSGLSRYCLIRPAVDLSNVEEMLVVVR